jgi:hypothetical protein
MIVYAVLIRGWELIGLYESKADAEASRDTLIYRYKNNDAATVEEMVITPTQKSPRALKVGDTVQTLASGLGVVLDIRGEQADIKTDDDRGWFDITSLKIVL